MLGKKKPTVRTRAVFAVIEGWFKCGSLSSEKHSSVARRRGGKVGGKIDDVDRAGRHARASRQLAAAAEKTVSALMNARSFMH